MRLRPAAVGLLLAQVGCVVSLAYALLERASVTFGRTLPMETALSLAVLVDQLELPANVFVILAAFLFVRASTRPSAPWLAIYGLGWAVALPLGHAAFRTVYTFWGLLHVAA